MTIDAAQKKMLYLDFSSEVVDLAPLPVFDTRFFRFSSIAIIAGRNSDILSF